MTIELGNIAKTGKYSATAVAKLLGVTVRTVANYRLTGKLKAKVNRHNNRYYFTGEELIRFWRTV